MGQSTSKEARKNIEAITEKSAVMKIDFEIL
jgi:hypothetical protein